MTASLPDGYVRVGGGAFADWKDAGNMLTASYPYETSTEALAWQAKSKDHRHAEMVQLNAYVIGIKVV